MSEWLPIDSAPRDGTQIIAYFRDENGKDDIISVSWFEEDEDGPAGWYDIWGGDYKPLYWMSIPEIPKKKHHCVSDLNTYECKTGADGNLYIHYLVSITSLPCVAERVKFCPFCGEASENL